MKESCVGKERVKVPSPSSVTVIWFVVPAIQEVRSETEAARLFESVESKREARREERVEFPETTKSVVEAVCDTERLVVVELVSVVLPVMLRRPETTRLVEVAFVVVPEVKV